VYVASSWRNPHQPLVVVALRKLGLDVYDFRSPPNRSGFSWRQVDPEFQGDPVNAAQQAKLTSHPIAIQGHASDMNALRLSDACVYVLPCGISASWELGYAQGQGKPCAVVWLGSHEPELMLRDAKLCASLLDLSDWAMCL
jgi:hypothetical protein